MKSIWVNVERCVACKTCEIVCALNRSSLSRKLPDALYEAIPPLSQGKSGTGRSSKRLSYPVPLL
jgi:carbon-monoxide dehydrogenase iron sulfur subunit